MLHVVKLALEGSFHGAASLVTQHQEQWRVQMLPRVLQAAHYFRRNHIAGQTQNEQLAEVRVEDQLRGHARIAATENRGVRLLTSGEIGQSLLADGREMRLALPESLVSGD